MEIPKKEKLKIYEEEVYNLILPYNSGSDIFNKDRFDIEIITKGNKKLVIVREKENEEREDRK